MELSKGAVAMPMWLFRVLTIFTIVFFSGFAAYNFAIGSNAVGAYFALAAAVTLAFVRPGSLTAKKRRVGLLGAIALLVLGALPLRLTYGDVFVVFALPVTFLVVMGPLIYLVARQWHQAGLAISNMLDTADQVYRLFPTKEEIARASGLEPTSEDLVEDEAQRQQYAEARQGWGSLLIYDNVSAVIRGIGPVLLALGFLLFWIAVYAAVWFFDPTECSGSICSGAFLGLDEEPLFGDFVYMAVSGVVGNTPPGIVPATSVAKMVSATHFLSAALLLGAYTTAVFSRVSERPVSGAP
jgi:hypothetical protein